MSEKNITPFSFEDQAVRVVTINGEPWFVAKDVVESVEAKWHHKAISHIPEQWKGSDRITTPGAHEDYRSIKAHAALIGRRLTPKQAADLGRMATFSIQA